MALCVLIRLALALCVGMMWVTVRWQEKGWYVVCSCGERSPLMSRLEAEDYAGMFGGTVHRREGD